MLLLLILEVAGVVVAYFFFGKVEAKLQFYLDNSLVSRYNGTFKEAAVGGYTYSSNGDAITAAWDIVQLQVSCRLYAVQQIPINSSLKLLIVLCWLSISPTVKS